MMQTVRFACCVALLSVLPAAVGARQTQLAQSKPATVTATIEAIDKANRTVTLKRANVPVWKSRRHQKCKGSTH